MAQGQTTSSRLSIASRGNGYDGETNLRDAVGMRVTVYRSYGVGIPTTEQALPNLLAWLQCSSLLEAIFGIPF